MIPKDLARRVVKEARPWLDPPCGATVADPRFLPWIHYIPKVFIWLPESVDPLHYQIVCPYCEKPDNIQAKEYTEGRHVYGDRCYYFIGRRYTCSHCVTSQSSLRSFSNYHPVVLNRMGFGIKHSLPCVFSHKLALDNDLHARVVAPDALPPETMAKNFNEYQREIYTKRRLHALHAYFKLTRVKHGWKVYKTLNQVPQTRFSSFSDETGYCGHTLQADYLRTVIKANHELHKPSKLRQMRAWTGKILSIDHSFKIVKLVRLGRDPVFDACLSILNEAGQVLFAGLCYSKSLFDLKDQIKAALDDVPGVEIIYTDNIDDVNFFSELLPGLTVIRDPDTISHVHINQPSLDYSLPPNLDNNAALKNCLVTSFLACQRVCVNLLERLNQGKWRGAVADPDRRHCQAVVGLDTEWTVPVTHPELLQLCFEDTQAPHTKTIHLFHLTKIFNGLNDPRIEDCYLKQLLQHRQIYFTGKFIGTDISRLRKWGFKIVCHNSRQPPPETGNVIELGRFSKNRECSPIAGLQGRVLPENFNGQAITAGCSLKKMCAMLLGQNLKKDCQVSTWNGNLTVEQLRYAAADAAVSVDLFRDIERREPDWYLTDRDGSSIESSHTDATVAGANEDIVPAPLSLSVSDETVDATTATAVQAMPAPRSDAVDATSTAGDQEICLLNKARGPVAHATVVAGPHPATWSHPHFGSTKRIRLTSNRIFVKLSKVLDEKATSIICSNKSRGFLLQEHFKQQNKPILWTKSHIMPIGGNTWDDVNITSSKGIQRVLGDAFHVFGRFDTKTTHPAYGHFMQKLRDAIFVSNPHDIASVKKYLAEEEELPAKAIAHLLSMRNRWLAKRVRRTIPGPGRLLDRLRSCFAAFNGATFVDPRTGKSVPFYGREEKKTINAILKAAAAGYLSDPPGINLYKKVSSTAKDGLQQWRCIRGTNNVENWHRWLIAAFQRQPSLSPALAHVLLFEFSYQFSVRNGQLHQRLPKFGHNNISLEEEVQKLTQRLWNRPAYPKWKVAKQREGTVCRWGVISVNSDDHLYNRENIQEVELSDRLGAIANLQGVQLPILPIQTKEEHKLFKTLLRTHGGGKDKPYFEDILQQWKGYVDGIEIFPKQLCHLRRRYRQYVKIVNIKQMRKKCEAKLKEVVEFIEKDNELFDMSFFTFNNPEFDEESQDELLLEDIDLSIDDLSGSVCPDLAIDIDEASSATSRVPTSTPRTTRSHPRLPIDY